MTMKPFIMVSKKLKYQEINLRNKVTNLYSENYKSLKNEINEDIRKLKHIPCSKLSKS
jgi:hypothetical protein